MNYLYAFCGLITLIISYMYYNIHTLYSTEEPPGNMDFEPCEKIYNDRLMEDFAKVDDNNLIMCGADFKDFYTYYSIYEPGYEFQKGDLVLFNIAEKIFKKLELKNFPQDVNFFPHGLKFYKDYIYVINHAFNTKDGERFEIFKIIYSTEKNNKKNILYLNYIKSIKLPNEFMGATNGLAVVNENDIFFTTSFAQNPPAVDEINFFNKFKFFLIHKLNYYLNLKMTYLYHYKNGKITKIMKSNSVCDNGVAYDEKTGYIFLAQTFEKIIRVFKYENLEEVNYVKDIYLGYRIDNLIFDDKTRILNAAITGNNFYGGLEEIYPDKNFSLNIPFYQKINTTSASTIKINKKIYIVSPHKKYVLICGK